MISKIAAYFLGLGIQSPDGEPLKVGMWMSTSFAMRVLMLACHKAGFIVVPVYDALGKVNVEAVFNRTSVSIICVDKKDNLESILSMTSVQDNLKRVVKTISHMDKTGDVGHASEKYVYFDALVDSVDAEKLKETQFPSVSVEDLALILSTSGSSGEAKCVPLTHANITCIIENFAEKFIPTYDKLNPLLQVTSYSFLPLAHIFGFLVDHVLFALNGRVAYPSGDLREVIPLDLQVIFNRLFLNA